MASTIPVPIEFSLPDGWQAAPPDEVGAPEAGFVALRPPSANGFTANITISGEIRPSEVTLQTIADEGVAKLEAAASDVRLGRRNELDSETEPGLTQLIAMTVPVNGQQREILQMQVFLTMRDPADTSQRAVLQLVLTAAEEQFAEVIEDFQRFLETVRPDEGRMGAEG